MDKHIIEIADLSDLPDIERLSDIVQSLHSEARPDVFRMPVDTDGRRAFLETAISDTQWRVWLAKLNGKTVGDAMGEVFHKDGPIRHPHIEGHLHQICVDPDFRRQGLGLALTRHAVKDLQSQDIDRITVAYWEFNAASRALFSAAGFTPVMTTSELMSP